MSLKFLSRLRDKDRSPTKTKPVPPAAISAPRRGSEFNHSEIQIISWEPESEGLPPSFYREKGGIVAPMAPAKVPQSIARSSPGPSYTSLQGTPSALQAGSTMIDRSGAATQGRPEVHSRALLPPSSPGAREELSSPNVVGGSTSPPSAWQNAKRNADLTSPARPHVENEASPGFYRTDSIQTFASTRSLYNNADDAERPARSKGRQAAFVLGKKASVQFFRKQKSSSTDSTALTESGDQRLPRPMRCRSSSMSSLSSNVFNLRSKEKVPGLPDYNPALASGSVGRSACDKCASSSWKPGSVSSETSTFTSTGYAAEPDVFASKESGNGRAKTKAKGGIPTARGIKKPSTSLGLKSGSEGSSTTSFTLLESSTTSSNASLHSSSPIKAPMPLRDTAVPVEVGVKASPRGMPTVVLPLSSSPLTAANDSMSGLMATKLFQQLGPPPMGLDASAFEDRVAIVIDYINTRRLTLAGRVPRPPSPTERRGSLAPLTKPASLQRGISVASTEDEFDKVECQMEQEMLRSLTRGVYDRRSIEELRLDAVFLEARRRCQVGHTRTHFQLFDNAASTSSPLLNPDGRSWPDAASLSASPRSTNGILATDTLTGLGVPLRPAPRRKKRPTTAPESHFQIGSQLPASPLPRFGGIAPRSARPGTARAQRSPAPSVRSMQASDESHEATTREGYGLGFDIARSAALNEDEGRTPAGLFTPQSFSARSPLSAASAQDVFVLRSAHMLGGRPAALAQGMSSSPSTGSQLGGGHANFYRRGSSDRESNSSHTTRSTRSPMTATYGRWSSRFSAGTRHSQDTNDTADTSESTLAGGVGHLLARIEHPALKA
ncbi:hypothetical protein ACQY0O_003310 [Thecaphora frezii]